MPKHNSWRKRKYSSSNPWRKIYKDYLESPAWKIKREERLAIDKYKCVNCSGTKILQVHHKTYVRLGNELMDDLETLCKKCHRKKHHRKF